MFTLADTLKDPIFDQAKVVAGQSGLDNPVEWSHIIDVPHMLGHVSARHLIITTGQGLPKDDQAQADLIQALTETKVSGMVISIGKILKAVPPSIIRSANRCNFPIITLPSSVRFVDITRTIHEKFVSHQYALLKRSDHIHQTLSHIVLEGGGLQEVAQILAKLVQRAVTIEDPKLILLANADYGERDPARQASIEAGGTPPHIQQFLDHEKTLHKASQSLRPIVLHANPEYGLLKDRIVAPIVVERQVYGYLWLIASEDPLNEADVMAIERAAIVAALIMLKDMAVDQTEARLQADVISQLLSGHPHTLALKDKANRLGLDLDQKQRVLLMRPPDDHVPNLRLAKSLSTTIETFSSSHIIQPLGQDLILILPNEVNAKGLSEALIQELPGLRVGIGNAAPALVDLRQSHAEAEEALKIGLALTANQYIYDFAELGFLHWLYQLPKEAQNNNPYIQRISNLDKSDKAARAQLLQTLEAYLDCGGNASETARTLKIHRNTLAYRIKQIEQACYVDLDSPDTRLNFQIALKAYRLKHQNDSES